MGGGCGLTLGGRHYGGSLEGGDVGNSNAEMGLICTQLVNPSPTCRRVLCAVDTSRREVTRDSSL